MTTLDFLIIIPVAVGFVFGLFKGLIKELTSLVAIFLGIYGAKLFSPIVSPILIKSLNVSDKIATPIAYLIVFVVIAVVLLILANFLDKIFNSLALGGVNKLLGGIFGGLKYALIVSVLLNVFNALDSRFGFVSSEVKEESFAFRPMLKFGPVLWEESKQIRDRSFDSESQNEEETEIN